jgi:hypothetical protein
MSNFPNPLLTAKSPQICIEVRRWRCPWSAVISNEIRVRHYSGLAVRCKHSRSEHQNLQIALDALNTALGLK